MPKDEGEKTQKGKQKSIDIIRMSVFIPFKELPGFAKNNFVLFMWSEVR